jgi:hypothetical protein
LLFIPNLRLEFVEPIYGVREVVLVVIFLDAGDATMDRFPTVLARWQSAWL